MDKVRLEFEDWYSRQKLDQIAAWHEADSLAYDRAKYPDGRYTVFSQKQTCWEVWKAAYQRANELVEDKECDCNCEVIDTPDGKKVKISYVVVPLTPHNSARNHVDVEVETEDEAKLNGIKYIPETEGEYFTAEQILEYMVKNLRGEDIVEILKCEKESDMIAFHTSVGRWMRNTFKLWDTKNPHLDGMNPDEMSTEILKGIWRTVVRREHIGM